MRILAPESDLIESKIHTTHLSAERHAKDALAGRVVYAPCPVHPTGGPLAGSEVNVKSFERTVSADGLSHHVWLVVVRRLMRPGSRMVVPGRRMSVPLEGRGPSALPPTDTRDTGELRWT